MSASIYAHRLQLDQDYLELHFFNTELCLCSTHTLKIRKIAT